MDEATKALMKIVECCLRVAENAGPDDDAYSENCVDLIEELETEYACWHVKYVGEHSTERDGGD